MSTDTPTSPQSEQPVDYAGTTPPSGDETNMAMLIYILGIITGFIGPLILWLLKKNESKFIDSQGKEVLNFQITTFLVGIACVPLFFIIIGVFIWLGWIIFYLITMIMGALKVRNGVPYRFPFALRLLK